MKQISTEKISVIKYLNKNSCRNIANKLNISPTTALKYKKTNFENKIKKKRGFGANKNLLQLVNNETIKNPRLQNKGLKNIIFENLNINVSCPTICRIKKGLCFRRIRCNTVASQRDSERIRYLIPRFKIFMKNVNFYF
jgi:DNA-binding Lrp family transcriptional regulator